MLILFWKLKLNQQPDFSAGLMIEEELHRLEQLLFFERQARLRGFVTIAGVDEAGRGPLAGPVVAAACILPDGACIERVNDSKKLPPSVRAAIFEKIISDPAICYGVGIVDSILIDQVNILQATFQAMLIAISRLTKKPDYVLVDGPLLPPVTVPGEAIVAGDGRSQSIAAASIIAKETRDALMLEFHKKWPEYGFDSHKGYATKRHLEAIRRFGACPIHRLSFAPFTCFNTAYIESSFGYTQTT